MVEPGELQPVVQMLADQYGIDPSFLPTQRMNEAISSRIRATNSADAATYISRLEVEETESENLYFTILRGLPHTAPSWENAFLKSVGKALVLCAHPDDELGCAATLLRLQEFGCEIHHYFFSQCEESTRAVGLEPQQLAEECAASRKVLGIKPENTGSFDYPVRQLPRYRQDILEDILVIKQRVKPTLVFTPSSTDVHQDHHCIYEETVRAFKHCTILGYELPWNTINMSHDCLIRCEQRQMDVKLRAVSAYASQQHRNYANRRFFENLAGVRGVQANCRYAECFEVIRLVL